MKRLAALLLISFLPLSCNAQPGCENPLFFSSWKGKKALEFSLPEINSAVPFLLSRENAERPLLLVFWATWCPACVEEIAVLNRLSNEYREKDLEIIGLNVQEDEETLREFVKKYPIQYRILRDEEGSVAEQFQVSGLPTMILLAKGGEILYYGFSIPRRLNALLNQGE